MKRKHHILRDGLVTVGVLALCFAASIWMQGYFNIPEQITTTFAFGVFLVSLLTEGYFFGLAAALASVLLVNYAFTFPFFAINFLIPSNFYSAVVMAIIAAVTSALTTKMRRQEAMRAESELERMRANLLRAISHDLRTPLTTIYGACTTIREQGDLLTEQQKDQMLRGVQEDSQWLMRMVENLLSITRIDAVNVQLNKVPTAADELIDSVLVKFYKHYPEQPVELTLPEKPVLIPMDALLMEQVLLNILENAVHHGGGVTRLQLEVTQRENLAVFSVTDNGKGIAPERLPSIFTGFFDAKDRPADNARRNAGIGLSVCATIIRAHGGSITAENLPEGGARFRFNLKTEEIIEDEQ